MPGSSKKTRAGLLFGLRRLLSALLCLSSILLSAQIDKTLVLNGCTDFIEFPEHDLMDFNQNLSIECWIRPNCADGNRVILSKQWCQGDYGYYLSVNEGKLFWS
ncbi:MAG: hypothetical protein KDC44_06150, partial [Phaeodactylibacter sp.]|nr:hypothetical protein [Phaeodactylibacter sp.]